VDTIQKQQMLRPRSMAGLCRRREQLQAEGVRPETLAWAVAEISDDAIAIAELEGNEMVKRCLDRARDPEVSGQESEALLVLSAAGVSRVREELRYVGVRVALTQNEAFREIRRVGRNRELGDQTVYDAVVAAGAEKVAALLEDRSVPLPKGVAAAMVRASGEGRTDAVGALALVAAAGPKRLKTGLKVDARDLIAKVGHGFASELAEAPHPTRRVRAAAEKRGPGQAEALAELRFVHGVAVKRGAEAVRRRARSDAFRSMKATRKSGGVNVADLYRAIWAIGPARLASQMSGDPRAVERWLADVHIQAKATGHDDEARAAIQVGAFGVRRLSRGVKGDVSTEVGQAGADEVARLVFSGSATAALRQASAAASGRRSDLLGALSFVEQAVLERSTREAQHRRVGVALRDAETSQLDGQGGAVVRVADSATSLAIRQEASCV
jgi:hypothetical protein